MPDPRPPVALRSIGRAEPARDGEFVAIDLETTGLDALGDRIIEVGATRFDRAGAIDTFQSLVNPGRPIPIEVQELTSIRDADVAGAPPPSLVAAQLASYIAGRAVVGQNVAFDLGFLAMLGVEPAGAVYDTWELASVLLPTAARLNLGALSDELGLTPASRHRALADAEATRDAFPRLLELLERLPRATLVDLEAIAASAGWPARTLFASALAHVESESGGRVERLTRAAAVSWRPLEPVESPRTVSDADIGELFALATREPRLGEYEGFEARGGQREMARAVASTLANGGQLAVEAGTGTGKSLAYLVPSLLHALRSGERVVVSTNTLNLQDQLAGQDIPMASALVEAYEGVPEGTLHSAVLKGRGNYLCLERWGETWQRPAGRTLPEARLHARIATWLPHTETGDLAELYMQQEERAAWGALAADGNDCLQRRCAYVRDGSCFLLQARQRAAGSHVLVVNHALLLADAASDVGTLPHFEHVIVDEAHRLEGVATSQYGLGLSLRELRGLLEELGGASGVGGRLRAAATLDPSPLSSAAALRPEGESLQTSARRASERVPSLERALRSYVEERRETERGLEDDVPLTTARHSQPLWEEVEECAVHLDFALIELAQRLSRARSTVQAMPEGAAPGLDALLVDIGRGAQAVERARDALGEGVLRRGDGLVRWVRLGEADVRLQTAPLEVGERLAMDVYERRKSVVVTSATLAAGESFDFSMQRLGLTEPETLRVPSPFDYRQAVLVLAVTDVPEPDAPGHYPALHETLAEAVAGAEGRTLALFTSHGGLRQAAGSLRSLLAREGIGVLAQQLDGSPGRLLRQLVERPRTLLLGTSAFWEGVDVRGEALSQIAVARLPFPVPTDPVYAGRAELYEDPFTEYALPQALLRFRQGFGRLIRGSDERGVFIILDRRVLTRRYGEAFLDVLPDCEVRRVPTSAVANAVREWLAR